MPRNASGVFSLPPGTAAVPGAVIQSTNYNAALTDLVNDANAARPIGAGGTGAQTAIAARAALGLAVGSDIPSFAQARQPRPNLLLNPTMQISEQNGDTLGTSNGYYPADCWQMFKVGSSLNASVQRVAGPTIRGSAHQLEWKCTTAKASLAAGDLATITQTIEGYRISDLGWGTSAAMPLVDNFEVTLPPGIYYMHYGSFLDGRNYAAPFTISGAEANTPVRKTIIVPGDTSGTWLTDHRAGLVRDIILAAGSTYQGTAETWTATAVYCGADQTNLLASTSNVARLGDCSLTADPESTGLAPAWEAPDYLAQFLACQRYLPTIGAANTTSPVGIGMATGATAGLVQVKFLVPARVAPASITVSGAGHISGLNSAGTPVAATGIAHGNASQHGATLTLSGMSGLTAGHALPAQFNNATGKIIWNGARL